jgi:hypothetical protein
LKQPARSQSWIYAHGYRVVRIDEPTRLFWVCKYCHIHKATSVIIDCSKATSSAAAHLAQSIKGHNLCRTGSITPQKLLDRQLSLRQALNGSFKVSQSAANAIGNFNVQRFRYVLVLWLLDNNLPIELINRASTRELFKLASMEAEGAL